MDLQYGRRLEGMFRVPRYHNCSLLDASIVVNRKGYNLGSGCNLGVFSPISGEEAGRGSNALSFHALIALSSIC